VLNNTSPHNRDNTGHRPTEEEHTIQDVQDTTRPHNTGNEILAQQTLWRTHHTGKQDFAFPFLLSKRVRSAGKAEHQNEILALLLVSLIINSLIIY
jgi:hypothetical protein